METERMPLEAERRPVVFLEGEEAMTSSRDVASFFGKRHDDVLRAIDGLVAAEPDLRLRNFAETSQVVEMPNGGTRPSRSFHMTRDGFTLLAMGFTGNAALKWKLRYIDAFNTMERTLRQPIPDLASMIASADANTLRGALLESTNQRIALESKVGEMQADVDALERIAKADGSLSLRETAKALQAREKDFIALMIHRHWIFRHHGSGTLLGYSERTRSGDLEHKVTTVLRADGSEKVVEQVRVTPQGLAKLAKLFPPPVRAAA